MTYEASVAVIATHLGAAGATLTPVVGIIRRGDFARAPDAPTLAYWWDGDGESEKIPATFVHYSIREKVVVSGVWPVSNDSNANAALLDEELRKAARAVTSLLRADSQLGGNCADLTIGDADVGWREWTGAVGRAFEIVLGIHLSEEETIGA